MSASGIRLVEYLCGNAHAFAALPLGKPLAAFGCAQLAAVSLQKSHPQFVKNTHKISFVLLTFNLIGTFWTAGKLIKALEGRFHVSLVSPTILSHSWTLSDWSYKKIAAFNLLGMGALGFGAFKCYKMAHSLCSAQEARQGNVALSWEPPPIFKAMAASQVAQLVFSGALLALGDSRLETLVSLAGCTASLYSSTQVEWLKLSIEKPSPAGQHRITYFARLIEESNSPEKRAFCCHKHLKKKDALIKHLVQQMEALSRENTYHHRIQRRQRGEDHRWWVWNLPIGKLPSCFSENCDEQPLQNVLKSSISIISQGHRKGGKSDFGSVLYLAYALAQLGLAFSQKNYPHLAGPIYRVQTFMIAADLAAIAAKIVDYSMMYHPRWRGKNIRRLFPIFAIAGGYLAYLHFASRGPNLVSTLKGQIPNTDLSQIFIDTSPPIFLRLMQWVLFAKIGVNLALPLDNKKGSHSLHFASAAAEAISLWYLSHLSWIHFKRTFSSPLGNQSFSLFNHSFSRLSINSKRYFSFNLQKVTIENWFLIPDKQRFFPNSDAFQATLKRIYDYTSDFFKGSYWRRYWLVSSQTGDRSLHFVAQIVRRPLNIGEWNFTDLLTNWGGSAYEFGLGYGKLHLMFQ